MIRFASATLSRDEFLDWMGGSPLPPSRTGYSEGLGDRQVTLLWNERDGRQSPPIVGVSTDDMGEFFAFTATYVATFRPYTAFYRVIPLELAGEIEGRSEIAADHLEPLQRMIVGGVISEMALPARTRSNRIYGSNLIGARATLSSALGSSLLAGYGPDVMGWITDQWMSLRLASGGDNISPSELNEISDIWQLLASVAYDARYRKSHSFKQSDAPVSGFLRQAIKGGITKELLQSIGSDFRVKLDLGQVLAASREERIQAFNNFVSGAFSGSDESAGKSFLAGLMLALVGNGSFDLLRSAREMAQRSPAALIWFGICAALFDESNVLTVENCLGRRVLRDLGDKSDVFDPPTADLGAFEFKAMLRDSFSLEQINFSSTDAFSIELFPNVVTYVPRQSSVTVGPSLEEYHAMEESIREIKFVVDRVTRRISRASEPRQREMPFDDTKPRRRPR